MLLGLIEKYINTIEKARNTHINSFSLFYPLSAFSAPSDLPLSRTWEPVCASLSLELIFISDYFFAMALYLTVSSGTTFFEASEGSLLAFLEKEGSFTELSFFSKFLSVSTLVLYVGFASS